MTACIHKHICLIYTCLKMKVNINTDENNSCPRGEIGRHKGLKRRGINTLMSL